MLNNIEIVVKMTEKGREITKRKQIILGSIKYKRSQVVFNSNDFITNKSSSIEADQLTNYIENNINKLINHKNNKELLKNENLYNLRLKIGHQINIPTDIDNLSNDLIELIIKYYKDKVA